MSAPLTQDETLEPWYAPFSSEEELNDCKKSAARWREIFHYNIMSSLLNTSRLLKDQESMSHDIKKNYETMVRCLSMVLTERFFRDTLPEPLYVKVVEGLRDIILRDDTDTELSQAVVEHVACEVARDPDIQSYMTSVVQKDLVSRKRSYAASASAPSKTQRLQEYVPATADEEEELGQNESPMV